MIAMFIDGPLAGVMKEVPPNRTYEHAFPERHTICTCDSWEIDVTDAPAETLTYHVVLAGLQNRVVLMSLKDDEMVLLDRLKAWTMENLDVRAQQIIYRNCRDPRAFT
jgi:hypothetical protein